MTEGLRYQFFEWRSSRIHLLSVDLERRELRPVMGAEAFPFLRVQPILKAVEQGALAAGVSGYNLTLWHGLGVADEPLHALAVDQEIWTTGAFGAGGAGFLIGDGFALAQQNHIQIHLWLPDGRVAEVEHVNRGHDADVVAFTKRGGVSECPTHGDYYVSLTQTGSESMIVDKTSDQFPLKVYPKTTVIQSWEPLGLVVGDRVRWVQRLGAEGVRHVVSGVPLVLQDGQNIVPNLHLAAQESHGPDNWWVRKNPRAALGVSQDHKTAFMVIVEGRISSSKGLRLKELGRWMLHHGIYSAVNFDGGGSAFMWTRDDGLVADSTYGNGTLEGLRPDHYCLGVF